MFNFDMKKLNKMTKSNFLEQAQPYELLLKSVAYNYTKNEEDAADLLQETYLKALSNIEKYKQGTNLKAWLTTIMRNIFINNYRKNKRTLSKITKVNEITDSIFLKSTYIETPSSSVIINDALVQAFKLLSPELKNVFMKYYEGYKYKEIADELKMPLGTIKSKIFFTRKKLVEFLTNNGIHHSNVLA